MNAAQADWPQVGEHVVLLKGVDNLGFTAIARTTIRVNSPPTISLSGTLFHVFRGETLNLKADITDSDQSLSDLSLSIAQISDSSILSVSDIALGTTGQSRDVQVRKVMYLSFFTN